MRGTVDTANERRRGPIRPRLRSWLSPVGAFAAFLAAFLIPQLIAPAQAHAFNPVDALGDGFDFINPANFAKDAIEKAGAEAAGAIQDAFFWMLNQLFGGIQATMSVALLSWLTKLPDFSSGQVMQIQRSMQVAAGAFLGCVLTFSIIRYWLGSHTNGGGVFAGLEGVARTAFAALMIGLWPTLFTKGVQLSNAFASALLNDAAKQRLENLFQGLDMATLGLPAAGGATAGAIGIAIGSGISVLMWIIIAIASVVLFLGLIVMKIMLTAGTVLIFVGMPIALVFWPIPETSWIANAMTRILAVLLAIPVIWILVFAAASAIGSDVFFLSNNGKNENFLQTGLNILLIKPLVACALLYMAIVLPKSLLRMAPIVGGMRSPGSRVGSAMTSYATYRGMEKVSGVAGSAMSGMAGKAGAAGAAGQSPGGQSGPRKVPNFSNQSGGTAGASAAHRAAAENARNQGAAAAAKGAAGGAAAGAAPGAVAGAAAGAATGVAGAGATQIPKTAASRSNIPVSNFENAPPRFRDKSGGPSAVTLDQSFPGRVDSAHNRMNSMPAAERPSQEQVQTAWRKLDAAPSAQAAIKTASAAPSNNGETPRELATWSLDGGNPYWGSEAQQATKTIGEASPEVREQVVTGGKGYGNGGSSGGFGGGSGGGGNNGGGGFTGNGGGNAAPTPRPTKSQPALADPTANHKRPAIKKGES